MDAELLMLVQRVTHDLRMAGLSVATAESCTGGWVAQVLTDLPGSALWFERGFVTYSNMAKHEMLDVPTDILAQYGAVSEPTACAMVAGALAHSHADLALAVTGIAGPDGGTAELPIGTVCFAWGGRRHPTRSVTLHFQGDRTGVRRQAVLTAIQGLTGPGEVGDLQGVKGK